MQMNVEHTSDGSLGSPVNSVSERGKEISGNVLLGSLVSEGTEVGVSVLLVGDISEVVQSNYNNIRHEPKNDRKELQPQTQRDTYGQFESFERSISQRSPCCS